MTVLSLIIPTRDRANLLAQALSSLRHQALSRENFEVIVVDNGSSDATPDVIEGARRELGNVVGVHAGEPGLHNGRHAGMAAAAGDVLVFADDDIEALPSWLQSIEEAFSDPDVALVGGNNYPLFVEAPPSWLLKLWNKDAHRGRRMLPALSVIEYTQAPESFSPYFVFGCNFAVRREVVVAAGGFHPDGMPKQLIRFRGDGETHISKYVAESGRKCVFHPGASIRHKVTPERMTFGYFRQRGYNQGVSDSFTELRNRGSGSRRRRVSPSAAVGRLWDTMLRMAGDGQVKLALDQFDAGYGEGFAFHQRSYNEDVEVRAWVHRDDYF